MKKTENVFRNRNYRLVFFGALVSEIGALLYSFAVSFYILKISGNNAFLQGLYLALCSAAMLVFTPVGGVLGDRFNKAKIMYICDFCKGANIILATVLMLLFPEANAHNFTIKSAVESILGVVLAGILYAALPVHTLFFIVGAGFVASGVSEMFIRCPHTPPADRLTLKTAVRDMGDGLRYLKTQKAILALLGSIIFINFFFAPITGNFIPYFIRTDLAGASSYLLDSVLTPELWSSVISVCVGIGSLLGAAVLSGRKQAEKCGHTVAVRLCITAVIIITLAFGYWLQVDRGNSLNAFLVIFCAGSFLTGVLLSAINIPVSTAIMRIVDKDKLSKVNSITSVSSQGMIPIASVIAGAVLQSFGSTVLLFICALGFTATAVMLLINKPVREL